MRLATTSYSIGDSVINGDLIVENAADISGSVEEIKINEFADFVIPAGQLRVNIKNMGTTANENITVNGVILEIGKSYDFIAFRDTTTSPAVLKKSVEITVVTNGSTVDGYYQK